jgi:hypothetical protein
MAAVGKAIGDELRAKSVNRPDRQMAQIGKVKTTG